MTNEKALELINSLDILSVDSDGETCHSVTVKADKYLEDVLRQLGKSEQYIRINVTEQEDFNLCWIAWDYASWFDGVEFTNN